MCSRPTFVSRTTGASSDVRRVEPPAEPRFDDGGVDAALGELRERRRRQRLELRRADRLGRGANRARPRARTTRGSVSSRSCQPLTCGDVYAPTPSPSARSSAAIVRVAVDLPFVPTTCTDGNARCGLPSASRSARILPRPNSSGHGDSDATHSVAVNAEAGSGTRGARRSRPRVQASAGSFARVDLDDGARAAALLRPARERVHDRSRVALSPRLRDVAIDVIPEPLADDDAPPDGDPSMRANATSPVASIVARRRASKPREPAQSRIHVVVEPLVDRRPRPSFARERRRAARPGPRPAPRGLVAARGEHRIQLAGRAASVTWNSAGAPRARYHSSTRSHLFVERQRPVAVRPDRVRAAGHAVREPEPPAVELLDLRREPELVPDRLELVSPRSRRAHGDSARASRARPRRPPPERVRDEALVREHLLAALDLLAQARALRFRVAVRLLRSGLTTASKIRRSSSPSSFGSTPLRRNITAASCTRSSASGLAVVAGLRPRRHDQPRLARRELRPDLLGDVRHHRMQQLEQALERRERGRARVRVARVQARLDRLGVPVAEVVEGQVVELARRRAEVELVEVRLDRALRRREPREDPALLERRRTLGGLGARVLRAAAGARSRACSRACVPPRSRLPRTPRPAPTPSS